MKLPNGKPPRIDLWGHNPFDGRFPNLKVNPIGNFRGFNDIDTLHQEIVRDYRAAHMRIPKLWLSEWTVISNKPSRVFPQFYVSARRQSRWLVTAYHIVEHTRYVVGMGWFTLLDEPPAPGSADWGLMSWNGVPKPAFYAYEKLP